MSSDTVHRPGAARDRSDDLFLMMLTIKNVILVTRNKGKRTNCWELSCLKRTMFRAGSEMKGSIFHGTFDFVMTVVLAMLNVIKTAAAKGFVFLALDIMSQQAQSSAICTFVMQL
jgi:hypothetical protein